MQTLAEMRNRYVREGPSQVGTEYVCVCVCVCGQLYIYIQGGPVEIQTPAYPGTWSVATWPAGRPPVLLLSSVLPSP